MGNLLFWLGIGAAQKGAGSNKRTSSAELAVKHVSWSKVCAVAALAYTGPGLAWRPVAFSAGGDGDRRSPARLAIAGRNLWLLGIWLEQNVLKKIPLHDRYKEFTDELTNAHVPELCLER